MAVVINADFRGPAPSFAFQRDTDDECTVETSAAAFVRALAALADAGAELVSYNGTRYVWGPMLDAVGPELQATVKRLALGAVDVMACFFAEKGFFPQRRRMSVADTSARGYRFPCDKPRKDDHASVCGDIAALLQFYRSNGRLYWMPAGGGESGRSTLKERRIRTWAPCSAPSLMTVAECMDYWKGHPGHPAGFMQRPPEMVGGMVPRALLQ